MERNSKIIELFGLPGSGKTTIMNNLNEKNVININEITKVIKKRKHIVLLCFPYFKIFLYLILIINTKEKIKYKIRNLIISIKMEIIYKYFKKYSNYEYLINDHGLLQQFISNLNGRKLTNSKIKHIKKLLLKSRIDYAVKIDVDIELALQRMNQRNRNSGRLDLEKDEKKKLELFNIEKENFDLLEKITNEIPTIKLTTISNKNSNNYTLQELI